MITDVKEVREIFDSEVTDFVLNDQTVYTIKFHEVPIFDTDKEKLFDKFKRKIGQKERIDGVRNFVCKNGCKGKEQDEDYPEYCVECVPWYGADDCPECDSKLVIWETIPNTFKS